jgi:hypothetical protein
MNLVQSTSVVQVPEHTIHSLAFLSDNSAKNLLVVLVTNQESTAFTPYTINDTNHNVYVSGSVRQYPTEITGFVQLFYALKCAAGPNEVTLSAGDSVPFNIAIHEFSGVDTLDVRAVSSGTGLSQDSGAISTNFADELLFGYGSARSMISISPGTGWTQAEVWGTSFLTQYKIVSSKGAYNSTTTSTEGKAGICNWVEEILAFYEKPPVTRSNIIEF